MSLRNTWKEDNRINLHTDALYTKTTLFILPILGYTYRDFSFSGKNYLINCYISDIKKPKLYCIFDNTHDSDDLKLVQARLTTNFLFTSSYLDNDGLELVHTFNLGTDFEDDYYKFLDGKYSKFSRDLKDLLTFAYGRNSEVGYKASVYEAIYPIESKRKKIAEVLDVELSEIVEVFDKPDLKIEYYQSYSDLIKQYDKN